MRELRAALTDLSIPLTTPGALQALGQLEASGQSLSKQDFRTLVKMLKSPAAEPDQAPAPPPMLQKQETVGDVFRRFDVSNTDTLSPSELRAALGDLKLPQGTPLEVKVNAGAWRMKWWWATLRHIKYYNRDGGQGRVAYRRVMCVCACV